MILREAWCTDCQYRETGRRLPSPVAPAFLLSSSEEKAYEPFVNKGPPGCLSAIINESFVKNRSELFCIIENELCGIYDHRDKQYRLFAFVFAIKKECRRRSPHTRRPRTAPTGRRARKARPDSGSLLGLSAGPRSPRAPPADRARRSPSRASCRACRRDSRYPA